LKQARHRASRRCLNDGARSSLPQYRQTGFSVLDPARDGRGDRCGAFVVFAGRAFFGATPTRGSAQSRAQARIFECVSEIS
jgi:hypothetical protein